MHCSIHWAIDYVQIRVCLIEVSKLFVDPIYAEYSVLCTKINFEKEEEKKDFKKDYYTL